MDPTSHILEEDAVVWVEKALHHGWTGWVSWKDFIDLEFFTKLFSLKLSRLWDLDRDARVYLIDERDASSPDPVDTRKLALDIHHNNMVREAISEESGVLQETCFKEKRESAETRGLKSPNAVWLVHVISAWYLRLYKTMLSYLQKFVCFDTPYSARRNPPIKCLKCWTLWLFR